MNQFTTDLVQALVQKEDVTEIFRSHLENVVNTLLASELTNTFWTTKNMIVLDLIQGIHEMVRTNERCTQSLENFISLFLVIGMATLSNRR